MNTFRYKLPSNKYHVKVNSGKKLRKFLESYGCYLDTDYAEEADESGYITVWVGTYDYTLGRHGGHYSGEVISTKKFKKLVIDTVGEA